MSEEFTCILIDAKNPQWADEAKTMITVEAKWQHIESEGYLGFLATPNDPEAHGRDLLERCKNGEFGTIADYVPPPEPEPVPEPEPEEE